MVSAYAIPRYLLEIYKTDEENFEPYVPKKVTKKQMKKHMMLKKTKMVSHFIKEKSKKFIITEIYIL